jgi:hypothetical protein
VLFGRVRNWKLQICAYEFRSCCLFVITREHGWQIHEIWHREILLTFVDKFQFWLQSDSNNMQVTWRPTWPLRADNWAGNPRTTLISTTVFIAMITLVCMVTTGIPSHPDKSGDKAKIPNDQRSNYLESDKTVTLFTYFLPSNKTWALLKLFFCCDFDTAVTYGSFLQTWTAAAEVIITEVSQNTEITSLNIQLVPSTNVSSLSSVTLHIQLISVFTYCKLHTLSHCS